MPEKCRVSVCGFDPMLVKGYVKTGYRALWFYLPDELWADYPVKINDKIQGKLLAVYNPKEEKTHEPNESFEWLASKETGYAILIPAGAWHQITAKTDLRFLCCCAPPYEHSDTYFS